MDITQYLEWQKQGRRAIRLEADCLDYDGAVRIWCYDHDIPHGASVVPPEPPPTTQKLKEAARARLLNDLAALEDNE